MGYTVKKFGDFPVPSQDVTNQTLTGSEKLNYSQPGRVWLVTFRLETGKLLTFFHSLHTAHRLILLSILAYNQRPTYYERYQKQQTECKVCGWGKNFIEEKIQGAISE